MKHSNRSTSLLPLLTAVVLLVPGVIIAQQGGDLQIEAKPLPGQLDVLQATAFQLRGTPPDRGPKPSSYRWEVLEGEREWPEPTPLPYQEIVNEFPADMAQDYLPQDSPLADEIPGLGFGGDIPGDFFDPGMGGGFDDFGW